MLKRAGGVWNEIINESTSEFLVGRRLNWAVQKVELKKKKGICIYGNLTPSPLDKVSLSTLIHTFQHAVSVLSKLPPDGPLGTITLSSLFLVVNEDYWFCFVSGFPIICFAIIFFRLRFRYYFVLSRVLLLFWLCWIFLYGMASINPNHGINKRNLNNQPTMLLSGWVDWWSMVERQADTNNKSVRKNRAQVKQMKGRW